MSGRIWLCPNCGQLGHHPDLAGHIANALIARWIGPVKLPEATQVRANWCPRCEAPYLVMHQEDVPRAERLESVGYTGHILDQLSKGGE